MTLPIIKKHLTNLHQAVSNSVSKGDAAREELLQLNYAQSIGKH